MRVAVHSTSPAALRRVHASLALVTAALLTIVSVPSAGLEIPSVAAAPDLASGTLTLNQGYVRPSGIGGLVFLDCNENGVQDLKAEFDERPDSGYKVTLERVGAGDSPEPTSSRKGEFYFEYPKPGSYVLTLRVTSSRYRATTTTRRDVIVSTTGVPSDAYVQFGLHDTKNDSGCPKSSTPTSTPRPANDQRLPGSTTGWTGSSGSSLAASSGSSLVPSSGSSATVDAAATAAAATATSTAHDRMLASVAATATALAPTATPLPTSRLSAATPKTARFHLQAVVDANGPNRQDMLAQGAFVSADAAPSGARTGGDLLSMRIQSNDRVDDILLTCGTA